MLRLATSTCKNIGSFSPIPQNAASSTRVLSQHQTCHRLLSVPRPINTRVFSGSSRTRTNKTTSSPTNTNSPGSSHAVPSTHHQSTTLNLKPLLNFKAMAQPENAAMIEANIKHRNLPSTISVSAVNALHRDHVEKSQTLDKSRAERNRIAAEMKELFSGKKKPSGKGQGQDQQDIKKALEIKRQELMERGRDLKGLIQEQEQAVSEVEALLYSQAALIPNHTHPTSPIGPESAARLVRVHGQPRLNKGVTAYARPEGGEQTLSATTRSKALEGDISSYPLLDHVTLSRSLDLLDFESATSVTGARWYYLKNEAALLELALIQLATQRAVRAGYMPVITPDVVRPEVVQACGFQPRDEVASQTYWVTTVEPGTMNLGQDLTNEDTASSDRLALQQQQLRHSALCMVATAEIALAGMNLNKVLEESQLPIRMAAFGRAFRAEAGSRGAEVKGLYRVHQFSKVELFTITKPEDSDQTLEEIRKFQEDIFEELGLCYRVLDMPTEELGASAYKKYDIEAWMPGRNSWGEISSTSNCTDYQSRRLNIRYRTNKIVEPTTSSGETGARKQTSNSYLTTDFVHTLNGTAMAVPRIIVALLETYQQEDGSVHLPECLWPFMAGIKVIKPKTSP